MLVFYVDIQSMLLSVHALLAEWKCHRQWVETTPNRRNAFYRFFNIMSFDRNHPIGDSNIIWPEKRLSVHLSAPPFVSNALQMGRATHFTFIPFKCLRSISVKCFNCTFYQHPSLFECFKHGKWYFYLSRFLCVRFKRKISTRRNWQFVIIETSVAQQLFEWLNFNCLATECRRMLSFTAAYN